MLVTRRTQKTIPLFVAFSLASCLIMIVVDYHLGSHAEFLNAFSVLERLLGRELSVNESLVARKLGAAGGFVVVAIVNVIIGGILVIVVRLLANSGHGAR